MDRPGRYDEQYGHADVVMLAIIESTMSMTSALPARELLQSSTLSCISLLSDIA